MYNEWNSFHERNGYSRDDIVNELKKNDSTVISYPDRGPWGDSSYRGNCSGWIQAFLIWKYQVKKMAELFSGSGTGYDVAKDMGIDYIGADLNPNPVRPNILTLDAIYDEVPDEFRNADFIFQHPAYSSLIGINWAGKAYEDVTGELAKKDLGNMPWTEFIKTLNFIIMKYYTAIAPGAKMGILMGDIRRKGVFRSMICDIVKPGRLEQVIIKEQHNCVSNGTFYSHKNFVPIVHEYIMILKKCAPYMIDFVFPSKYERDVRDSKSATWKDVTYAVLCKIGRPASLEEIYQELESCQKSKANPHWKEKIRQVLQHMQQKGLTINIDRGIWSLTSY